MRKLADDGMTMVVVTHEMGFASDVADRVLFIDGGVIVEQGKAKSLLDKPQHARTQDFLRRVLHPSVKRTCRIESDPQSSRLAAKPLCGHRRRGGPTPPLDVDRNVSVAIIGGGFAGLSTALHLAEQGTEAIVLEAQQPGWGASGNNGGQLNPGLKLDPDTIEADFGTDLGCRMIAFAYSTPVFTLELIRRLGIECEARQNGTLRAAYHAGSSGRLSRPPPSSACGAACPSACSGRTPCARRPGRIDICWPCAIPAVATCSR